MDMFNSIRNKVNGKVILPLFFFGVLFSLISFANHYCFRTYAYDLGLFNNEAYSYSHFEFNKAPLMLPYRHFQNFLGDHFSLYAMFIGQFCRFFGSSTFLLFQIAIILAGAVGFYKWTKLKFADNMFIRNLSVVYFLSIWGIYSALSFEYHDNVTAAMLVPWLFYFFELRKYLYVYLFTLLILVGKENMALWLFFIFLGLAISSFRDRKAFYISLILAFISMIYFIAVVKWIIPSLNRGEDIGYFHFKYSALGSGFGDVISTLIQRPVYFFGLLFKNHADSSNFDYVKAYLHLFVFLSVGVFLLFRPQYFVMLIPIYLQKLYHDDTIKWGPAVHYSIEFVPILSFAAYSFIAAVKNKKRQILLALIIAVMTLLSTVLVFLGIGNPYFEWYKNSMYFFSKDHYTREYNVSQVHTDLELIPPDAIISVNAPIAPHLAFRRFIYSFPYLANAEYIILLFQDSSNYPMTPENFNARVEELKKSGEWKILVDRNSLLILKRN